MLPSVYLACHELETPRTLNEVSSASNVPRKKISRDYRLLVHTFDPKIPAVDHIRCITRIANKVGLSEKTKRMAVKIMRQVVAMQISAGKGPMGIAATRALYCLSPGRGNQNTEGTFDCRWCDRSDDQKSL